MEIDQKGTKIWRNAKGQKHREDGPAIEYTDGLKFWYINGKLHREGGPAIEGSSGAKEWYIDGKYHREDGPAVEYTYGKKRWFIDGEHYSFEDWLDKLQISNEEKILLCLKWK